MKVLDKSLSQNKFTCIESWISDRQADISKQTDRLDCEYWRRLREHRRREAIGFHRGIGATSEVV